MIAKMKCSNCGAEVSNLKIEPGKKQFWFIIPLMLIGFLPLAQIYWFKGDAMKDLVISEVQKKINGRFVEITGLITNNGGYKFTSVVIEAEFFDAGGKFLDEASEYIRSDVAAKGKEYFKIRMANPTNEASAPETKMVVKIVSGRSQSL